MKNFVSWEYKIKLMMLTDIFIIQNNMICRNGVLLHKKKKK